jgi:hypothetical protein
LRLLSRLTAMTTNPRSGTHGKGVGSSGTVAGGALPRLGRVPLDP